MKSVCGHCDVIIFKHLLLGLFHTQTREADWLKRAPPHNPLLGIAPLSPLVFWDCGGDAVVFQRDSRSLSSFPLPMPSRVFFFLSLFPKKDPRNNPGFAFVSSAASISPERVCLSGGASYHSRGRRLRQAVNHGRVITAQDRNPASISPCQRPCPPPKRHSPDPARSRPRDWIIDLPRPSRVAVSHNSMKRSGLLVSAVLAVKVSRV